MESRFNIESAKGLDDLDMRVYTSRLLGVDQNLVLHGGGNTSVKIDDILYVKGSGWDLETIEREGFSPAKIESLISLLEYDRLSDSDMVKYQREALIDSDAPNPSVEAILHALIPYKFVDHTHADAVVTISNSINGERIIKEIYGDSYLIVPYIMPGFILAKEVYNLVKDIDWDRLDGIILHNHGIFTFDNDGERSYNKMIESVSKATEYLKNLRRYDLESLREIIKEAKGGDEVVLRVNSSDMARCFASHSDKSIYKRGVLTPEHIIRTKRFPALIDGDYQECINRYMKDYRDYFNRYATSEIILNPAPHWLILRDYGVVAIGKSEREAKIIEDIVMHTIEAILNGEALGGYRSINERDSFNMEYWELEQNKLKAK